MYNEKSKEECKIIINQIISLIASNKCTIDDAESILNSVRLKTKQQCFVTVN